MSAAAAAAGLASDQLMSGLELLPELGFSIEVIKQLRAAAAEPPGLLETALDVVEALPSAVRHHADLGIPFDVTARTLRDLDRRIHEYHERHGVWGFDRQKWMQNHLQGALFEIGRLQYVPGRWRESFDLYRGQEPQGVWAVADAGLWCDGAGRPTCENGDFRTIKEECEGGVCGHLAEPYTGLVSRYPVSLPQWTRAAGKGDTVLQVHIPSGPNFTPEACAESLREARQFFQRHFPEKSFRAISCRTWLLDPALRGILPKDSNISQFSRLFRPLVVAGADDAQHIERIFGLGADWKNLKPHTRLQKAAKDFLMQGGRFHLSSGFLLWDDPWFTGNTPLYQNVH